MSHLDFANQSKYASQKLNETQNWIASHYTSVTLTRSASQENFANQSENASQWEIVTQGKDASQMADANHELFASPHPSLQPKTGGDMCGVGKW